MALRTSMTKKSQSKLITKINHCTSPISILILFIAISNILITTIIESKCVSNSNMKYQFNYTTQLTGYHSICSQFSKRTCCSGKNFDALARKISTKLLGTQGSQLSVICRRRLSNLMCSTCDGDIGQGHVQGVCRNICEEAYDACQNQYFSIDSLGKITICKEDDMICSMLKHIIPEKSRKSQICDLFGIEMKPQGNCWDGKSSHLEKGPGHKKVSYNARKSSNSKKGKSWIPSWLRKIQTKYLVYLGVTFTLSLIFIYKWLITKYRANSRMIKNL